MRMFTALTAAVALTAFGATAAIADEGEHCGDELGHEWHEVHEMGDPYVGTVDQNAGNTGLLVGAYETVGHDIVECTVIKTVEDELP